MVKSVKKEQDGFKKLNKAVEDLAAMTANGFANTATKNDLVKVEKRLDKLENEASHTNARLGRIETEVEQINRKMFTKDEFDDLSARVKYLEIKAGVKSGK
ncbi:MAG TPA: hypothetical protein VJJ24_02920 [Candidatus Paceibacterota bacterium]